MKATFQILIKNHLGETLNTRESAKQLFALIQAEKAEFVDFDFSEITFISRSFADQFHKERMLLKDELNLIIQISNAEDSVRKMLVTVEKTQTKTDRYYIELPTFIYTNDDKLVDYLLSI